MASSKLIREALNKKGIPDQTVYSRIKAVRAITKNSISPEIAIAVVASKEGIDVHRLLKKEGRNDEIEKYSDAVTKFDFENSRINIQPKKIKELNEQKMEKSPYETPLSKFDIDSELISDCKIVKPYRNAVSNAFLTLETRMRAILNAPSNMTGIELVTEAAKQGLFIRHVGSESQGLEMLFRSAVLWIRNPPGHRKVNYDKESALKLVLYADYLMKLFDDLKNKRI